MVKELHDGHLVEYLPESYHQLDDDARRLRGIGTRLRVYQSYLSNPDSCVCVI